ncbi:MAG TPA: hypothetical protein VFO33_05920 [Casimicrobiaceae bacterium]|nr:hypothetical protein [Casimicrobiaceae bacterium]
MSYSGQKRNWWIVLRGVGLLSVIAFAASAWAASEALVDEFMTKSGLVAQLAQVETGVLTGIEQARSQPQYPALSGDQLARLQDATKAAYGADRLRNAMRVQLQASLPVDDTEQALKWLETPFGKRVTAIEEAGSTLEAYQRSMDIGAKTLADLTPARKADLERILKASGAVDLYASITLNQQLGVMRGLALSSGMAAVPSTQEMKAKLDLYRSQIAGALAPTLLANAAVLYAPLSDTELREYAVTLELPSSKRVTDAVGAALDKVLSAAAVELGRRLGDTAKPTSTTT